MLNVAQIRDAQERRLLPALKAWDDAKIQLESAIALAKSREQEFQEVSDDVRRKLDALDLVIRMAQGLEDETSSDKKSLPAEETRQVLSIAEAREEEEPADRADRSIYKLGTLLRRSSRPLISPVQRSPLQRSA